MHASHVDPCVEANTWGFLWIILVTEELQLIDSTFMYTLIQNQCESPIKKENEPWNTANVPYPVINITIVDANNLHDTRIYSHYKPV